MANISSIYAKKAVDAGVVVLLKQYLEQAERGDLISVALVGGRPDGTFTTASSECKNSAEMAGQLLGMAMRRLNMFVEVPD
jgi:hypothetical protein